MYKPHKGKTAGNPYFLHFYYSRVLAIIRFMF
jgi:hypothetical protein